MGDPIVAKPAAKAQAAATPSAVPAASAAASPIAQEKSKAHANFNKWNEKWGQIQNPPDLVDWIEHFRVCAIMYRYRNYDALFRCLDLFEAKIARGSKQVAHLEAVRGATPVMTQVVDRYNKSSAAVEHKRHMEQLRDSLARRRARPLSAK